MDNQIGTGAYDSLIGRLLNIGQQQGGILSSVSPELAAAIVLENDRPEWCFLKNEKCCSGFCDVAAAAAQRGLVRLRNPAASGCLAVVEVAAATWFDALIHWASLAVGTATVDFATAASGVVVRDSRQGGKPVCVLTSDNTGAAVSGTTCELESTSVGQILFISPPIVLAPGGSMDFAGAGNNIEVSVNVRWREREIRNYEIK